MSTNDQYALNWSNHPNHIKKAFDTLLSLNEFVDVTLSCEGKKITAHKILLSACSTYFHDLFRDNPCQHPIVILKDVKYQNLVDILKFMYNGEVSVLTENFESFLKTAELLQVSGLTDDENRVGGECSTSEVKNIKSPETSKKQNVKNPAYSSKVESSKKRTLESSKNDEEITQKKKKENYVKTDFDIKQESEFNLTDDNGDVLDPLDLDQEQDQDAENLEEVDISQPAGSQKFEIQDLLGGTTSDTQNVETLTCNICFKQFAHPLSLNHHRYVHMGATKCTICGLVLSRMYHLKVHMKTRHDI